MPPSPFSALPPFINTRRCTSMHFEENQLSRGLISLSPLPTAHPRIFQHSPVRSFTQYHLRFNLLRVDHLRFGSARATMSPIRTRFRCASDPEDLGLPHILIADSLSKRHAITPEGALTPCRHTVSGSISLRSQRFFSPFPHGTGSLSVAN